jgi:hypothetical protein
LEPIDRDLAPGLDIHLILDNRSSPVAKATKAWLAAHPRFQVHHRPKYASWLNQIRAGLSHLDPAFAALGRVRLS